LTSILRPCNPQFPVRVSGPVQNRFRASYTMAKAVDDQSAEALDGLAERRAARELTEFVLSA